AHFDAGLALDTRDALEVVGDEGTLRVDPAYEYEGELGYQLTVGNKKPKRAKLKARDQIGPEIDYFSTCILKGKEPEPSGLEGLADVRVIAAIHRSIDEKRPVRLGALQKEVRPSLAQEKSAPPVRGEPPKVDVRPEN
ncbi:MAG TPA: gfo/Idh/MocA family oxidoreductase, partial [Polyangiaceae bacterium]|nr:gfo/Idh/MocA family oxidoreductase [Polyangiaceae bacterium]